jgi:hypothetical protein
MRSVSETVADPGRRRKLRRDPRACRRGLVIKLLGDQRPICFLRSNSSAGDYQVRPGEYILARESASAQASAGPSTGGRSRPSPA